MIVVGPPAEAAEASDAELDAALDEALARLSPSRAAAEVAERLEHAAQARLRPRARALASEPPRGREARPRRRDASPAGSCACTAGASSPGARACPAARSTSSPGAAARSPSSRSRRAPPRTPPPSRSTTSGCAASRSPPSGSRRATCATATTSASTPCSSSRAAGRGTSPTSGKGDKAPARRLGAAPCRFASPCRWTRSRRINIAGDSTFALMLKAQERGHQLYPLSRRGPDLRGRPALRRRARGHASRRSPATISGFGEFAILDLGRDVDVVLMRQDPPFDLGYITATHLLERIQGETLVVNDPAASATRPRRCGCSISRSSCRRR